jgi:prepilin-type N-terminal cleavage/methylation domain-containing protein
MKVEREKRFALGLARSPEREPLGRLGALSLPNGQRAQSVLSVPAVAGTSRSTGERPVDVQAVFVRPARAAFTLMELMIALALTALLMVGLNWFVFSMGELWGKNTDKRLFEQHVRAVTRFLEHEMLAAALPPAGKAGQAAIAPQEVRPAGVNSDNLLTFELPEGSRLIAWPTQPLPEVVCSLLVRNGQGLVLLWHSRLEMHFADNPPHETLISPFATAMAYDYYDANLKRWTTQTALQRDAASGNYLTPQRIRFTFTYGKLTKDTMIALPIATEGLPNY